MFLMVLLCFLINCNSNRISYKRSYKTRFYSSPQSFKSSVSIDFLPTLKKPSISQVPMFRVDFGFDLKFSLDEILRIGKHPAADPCQSTNNHSFKDCEISMLAIETEVF